MIRRALSFALVLFCFTTFLPAQTTREAADKVNPVLDRFDRVRMLAMRALARAQDFKTVSLYGRGWGLDMPEGVAEDMVVEGVWLFDHLHAIDLSSMSLASSLSAEHPNLDQELAALTRFINEAAPRVLAYDEKVTRALADAKQKVNEAAKARTSFELQTFPAQPWNARPAEAFAGDGFRLGWHIAVLADLPYTVHFDLLGRDDTHLLEMARQAGVDFIRPFDRQIFDWDKIETQEGQYDFTRLDALLARLKAHDLGLWVRLPSSQIGPPQWLRDKLGDASVLRGPDGKPITVRKTHEDTYFFGIRHDPAEINPIDLFNDEVRQRYLAFVAVMIERIKASGVPIIAIELQGGGDRGGAIFATTPDPKDPAGTLARAKENEQRMLDYFRPQVEAIRKVDPSLPITMATTPFGEFNESLEGRDGERLVKELGLIPWGFSSENIWDYWRVAVAPVPFAAATTHAGSGDAYAQYAFSGYAHGMLSLSSLPQMRGFNWGDAMFYPDLRWEWTSMLGWRRFHERAQGMAPEMLNTKPATKVAMLWSETSGKYQAFLQDWVGGTYGFRLEAANYHKISSIGWGRILDSCGMSYDIVTEAQAPERLSNYKLLILPAVQAMPEETANAIRQFVRAGGTVIADSAPAVVDPKTMQPKGPGALADVFGADFDKFIAPTIVANSPLTWPVHDRQVTVLPNWTPNPGRDKSETDFRKDVFATFAPREGATILEKFTDGAPAVIQNTFGQGQAVVSGYPIGRQSFLSDIYHEHYGNNWPDLAHGSNFQQGVFLWFEMLLQKVKFARDTVVAEESLGRPIGDDWWPARNWTRATPGYGDYPWKTVKAVYSSARGGYGLAPRGVEPILRSRDGNPNEYLLLYNREGSYGYAPGAVHWEATNKEITVDIARPDVKTVYDLSLGVAVPFTRAKQAGLGTDVIVIQSMLEPSMGRMLVLSTDNVVRQYEGNRAQGGLTDDELRESIRAAAAPAEGELSAVIGQDQIAPFLQERSEGKPIIIGYEDPVYAQQIERLAKLIEDRTGVAPRITRTSPRYPGNRGVWRAIDTPDILVGNHHDSHMIASYGVFTSMTGHSARLPFMPSRSFPGAGRYIVEFTRPWSKEWNPIHYVHDPSQTFLKINPAPQTLVIGVSDPAGLAAAIQRLDEVLK